jgi:hypothetical protein
MVLKRCLNESERFGLTQQEIEIAEKFLRKNKTAGALKQLEAVKVYELYMVGCSFAEIAAQFPQHEMGAIVLTAAMQEWAADRERMHSTLRDRVKAKVVKSVIEQTDFLTAMLSVASAEHMKQMRDYILDPNAPKPSLRITSIKDYKEITETLSKLVQGATPSMKDNKASAMFDALAPKEPKKIAEQPKEIELDLDALLRQEEDD